VSSIATRHPSCRPYLMTSIQPLMLIDNQSYGVCLYELGAIESDHKTGGYAVIDRLRRPAGIPLLLSHRAL